MKGMVNMEKRFRYDLLVGNIYNGIYIKNYTKLIMVSKSGKPYLKGILTVAYPHSKNITIDIPTTSWRRWDFVEQLNAANANSTN